MFCFRFLFRGKDKTVRKSLDIPFLLFTYLCSLCAQNKTKQNKKSLLFLDTHFIWFINLSSNYTVLYCIYLSFHYHF